METETSAAFRHSCSHCSPTTFTLNMEPGLKGRQYSFWWGKKISLGLVFLTFRAWCKKRTIFILFSQTSTFLPQAQHFFKKNTQVCTLTTARWLASGLTVVKVTAAVTQDGPNRENTSSLSVIKIHISRAQVSRLHMNAAGDLFFFFFSPQFFTFDLIKIIRSCLFIVAPPPLFSPSLFLSFKYYSIIFLNVMFM